VAQATTVATSKAGGRRRTPASGRRGERPKPHLGRLALLVLILIGASFYVSPLRDFFTQQNRYQKASAELEATRTDNKALEREIKLLSTKAYVAQIARLDSLVPPETQVFVIKGLPGKGAETSVGATTVPTESSISVLDRVEDLWRTLLH
jgi:cell division protein FtsB